MTLELNEIRDVRKRLGLTQGELARKAGVSQSLVAKVESGRIDPTYSKARQIFRALDEMGKQHDMSAGEIMQKKVIAVHPNDGVRDAVELMKRYEISQLPVLEAGKVVGLISEGTILESMMRQKGLSKVRQVMDDAPPVIARSASVKAVADLLRFFSMVLVAQHGKYVGLITKADLITKMYGK